MEIEPEMDRRLRIHLLEQARHFPLVALSSMRTFTSSVQGNPQNPFRKTLTSHSKREISRSRFMVFSSVFSKKGIDPLTDLVSIRVVVMLTNDIMKMHTA